MSSRRTAVPAYLFIRYDPRIERRGTGRTSTRLRAKREAAEPLALLPEVPADGIEEYAADDLRGGYRWPAGSGQTAVVIFTPALAR